MKIERVVLKKEILNDFRRKKKEIPIFDLFDLKGIIERERKTHNKELYLRYNIYNLKVEEYHFYNENKDTNLYSILMVEDEVFDKGSYPKHKEDEIAEFTILNSILEGLSIFLTRGIKNFFSLRMESFGIEIIGNNRDFEIIEEEVKEPILPIKTITEAKYFILEEAGNLKYFKKENLKTFEMVLNRQEKVIIDNKIQGMTVMSLDEYFERFY